MAPDQNYQLWLVSIFQQIFHLALRKGSAVLQNVENILFVFVLCQTIWCSKERKQKVQTFEQSVKRFTISNYLSVEICQGHTNLICIKPPSAGELIILILSHTQIIFDKVQLHVVASCSKYFLLWTEYDLLTDEELVVGIKGLIKDKVWLNLQITNH